MTSSSPVVAVGGIAVVAGELLLIQRANDPGQGLWSLPGGRVEPGEPLHAAVERELLEETGLQVRCGDLVGWVERIADSYHYLILDFAVTVDGRAMPAPGDDAADARWVPMAEVPSLPLVEGLAAFLREHDLLPPARG